MNRVWPEPRRSGLTLCTGKICGRALGRGRDLDPNRIISLVKTRRLHIVATRRECGEHAMTPIILFAVALSAAMCVLAFVLATHALPFMFGLAAFHLAHACGAGVIVAGIVASTAAILSFASFASFVYLREVLRSQSAKLVVTVVYAAPAALAGYALTHGLIGAASLSEPLKQLFCFASGAFVAIAAMLRLSATK